LLVVSFVVLSFVVSIAVAVRGGGAVRAVRARVSLVGGMISGKQKGRRVAPTALRMIPGSESYGWDTSGRRDRPCFAV
jgi:hypothetical protein